MGELIIKLFEGILMSFPFPSKKDITINKKFKMLRKEMWYKNRHNALIQMNNSVRDFVEQTDIENILKDPEETKKFRIEFEKIVAKENL